MQEPDQMNENNEMQLSTQLRKTHQTANMDIVYSSSCVNTMKGTRISHLFMSQIITLCSWAPQGGSWLHATIW